MALKYFIEYTNVGGHLIRVEIDDPDFVGAATQVKGSCTHVYEEAEDPTVVFRGSYLKLRLEASQGQDFLDLFTEVERIIKVTAFRDSATFFVGWINPDGIFYDFVNQSWDIEFECSDGLGYLENLAYTDSSGNAYSGLDRPIDIVAKALQRTGLELNINIINGLELLIDDELLLTEEYFGFLRLNQDVFRDTGDQEIQSCKEVIEKVLTSANAYIIQQGGEWWIVRSLTLNDAFIPSPNTTVSVVKVDFEGAFISISNLESITTIGSEINNFPLFHCNENQSIEIRPSVDSVRNEYTFSRPDSIISNPDLENNGTTITGWTIDNASEIISLDSANSSVTLRDSLIPDRIAAITNNTTPTVTFQSILSLNFTASCGDPIGVYTSWVFSISDGVDTFYLNYDRSQWIQTFDIAVFALITNGGTASRSYEFPPAPINGDFTATVYSPFSVGNGTSFNTTFFSIDIGIKESLDATGQVWTGFQNPSRSSFVKDNIESFFGEQSGSASISDIYRNDGITPALPNFITERSNAERSINQYVVEDQIVLMKKPAKVFTGDVFGFVDYVQNIVIDNLPGVFHMIGKEYNSTTDVTAVSLYEVFGADTDPYVNIDTELTVNFGDNPKPTIR